MAITKHVQHPKSSATTANTQSVTVPRLPSSGDLLYGEIAVNYRDGYETLSIKNSSNQIIPFPTNHHIIEVVPNGSGIVGGQIGIDINDVESYYIYNDYRSGWQPLSTSHVVDESGLDGVPVVMEPQFSYVADPGLMYYSVYDQSTTSQTWTAMATLNPDSMRLAGTQEPKVIIDYFTSDQNYQLTANVLVFNATDNKLRQYGAMQFIDMVAQPELLYTYDPSKNLIYYNKNTGKAFRWTGSNMAEILANPTISTDNTMSAATGNGTVTVSSTMFSADTTSKIVMNKMTPASSANSQSHSSYSLICGIQNDVQWSSGVTTFGYKNYISDASHYSFVEGVYNTVSGEAAHAEGNGTRAYANYSHTQGVNTEANGTASFAAGSGTTTNNPAEFACGRFNDSKNDKYTSIFTVGCGTSNADRKNGLEVDDDGVIWILDSRGTRVSLQDTLGI